MRTTFSVLFYTNNSKEKDGLVPVLCRITINGDIAQFSCKLKVPPSLWNPSTGRVNGKSALAHEANSILESIRARIVTSYHELIAQGLLRSASQLRAVSLGHKEGSITLLEMLDKQNSIIASRIGKDRAQSTLNKYLIVRRHVFDFLRRKMQRKDIPIDELNEAFIRNFCNYLSEDVGLSQSSVWIYQMPLKTVATAAFNDGLIPRNPFVNYHVKPDIKEREFLTEDRLRELMDYPLRGNLDKVRDMFCFCCFTGLSFIDLKHLDYSDLVKFNGNLWIVSRRQKTKVGFQAKLLPEAMKVLKKQGKHAKEGLVFDIGGYTTINKRLKKIGIVSGVCKNLTFHMARHTFATLALSKGMSMESLRSILGHSDIQTTMIYAKITSKRLEKDYSLLSDGLLG